jgi:hypothetical protein
VAPTFFEAAIIKEGWPENSRRISGHSLRDNIRFQIIYNMVVVYSNEGSDKDFSVRIEWDKVEEYPKLKEAMERAVRESRVDHENAENNPDNNQEKVCVQRHTIPDSEATLNLTRDELFYLEKWLTAIERVIVLSRSPQVNNRLIRLCLS